MGFAFKKRQVGRSFGPLTLNYKLGAVKLCKSCLITINNTGIPIILMYM